MPLTITQVQSGQLSLCAEDGTLIGIFEDDGTLRLQVQAKLATGHGLATEATLVALQGQDTSVEMKLTDHDLLVRAVGELQRIRVLLEHLTDEKVHDHDLETRD